MARKRGRLHKRYQKRYKRNPDGGGGRPNPPLLTDLAEFIGPGFGAFAATRLLTRISSTALARSKPTWAKHAGALTSIGSFLAAWWGAHRIKILERHHTPIVVGSAIAAIQSIIQLYIPRLGWMIADASPQIESESLKLQDGGTAANGNKPPLPPDLEYLDEEDPNLYTYNDSFDSGRTGASAAAARASDDDKILSDLNLDDTDDINLGSLGN